MWDMGGGWFNNRRKKRTGVMDGPLLPANIFVKETTNQVLNQSVFQIKKKYNFFTSH